ncbi:YusW family protein [Sporosarcina sp. YIM B06819]|uniref:YusW family protein n=1 Tax=Sporosarcina sp. YIM B06819 TaxID=3081769 RepID=UPI00298D3271|nr:YusW family protein [Sporosarcina sp. YIM B06819]
MKTKWSVLIIVLLACQFIIIACSDKNIVKDKPDDDEKQSLGEQYGFTSFDVAIDTKDKKQAVIANYEEKPDKTEAMYENKMEDAYLHGNQAMDKLDKIFQEMDLDPEADDEDLIKQTAEAFGIMDYKTLKLTVTFKGHDAKKLMMSK